MILAFIGLFLRLIATPKFGKATFTARIPILMFSHKYAPPTSWAFPPNPCEFFALNLIELVYCYLASSRLVLVSQLFLPLS